MSSSPVCVTATGSMSTSTTTNTQHQSRTDDDASSHDICNKRPSLSSESQHDDGGIDTVNIITKKVMIVEDAQGRMTPSPVTFHSPSSPSPPPSSSCFEELTRSSSSSSLSRMNGPVSVTSDSKPTTTPVIKPSPRPVCSQSMHQFKAPDGQDASSSRPETNATPVVKLIVCSAHPPDPVRDIVFLSEHDNIEDICKEYPGTVVLYNRLLDPDYLKRFRQLRSNQKRLSLIHKSIIGPLMGENELVRFVQRVGVQHTQDCGVGSHALQPDTVASTDLKTSYSWIWKSLTIKAAMQEILDITKRIVIQQREPGSLLCLEPPPLILSTSNEVRVSRLAKLRCTDVEGALQVINVPPFKVQAGSTRKKKGPLSSQSGLSVPMGGQVSPEKFASHEDSVDSEDWGMVQNKLNNYSQESLPPALEQVHPDRETSQDIWWEALDLTMLDRGFSGLTLFHDLGLSQSAVESPVKEEQGATPATETSETPEVSKDDSHRAKSDIPVDTIEHDMSSAPDSVDLADCDGSNEELAPIPLSSLSRRTSSDSGASVLWSSDFLALFGQGHDCNDDLNSSGIV